MKHIRNITLIFFVLITVLFTASCKEDDGSGHIFKINIENNPKNLDAQMATDSESIMIITNMMEGLMKKQASGAIVPAAAESFEMSEDGLTYTFYLKQNQQWDTLADFTAEVTADDFVFAFERLFDKKTNSPHSKDYLCIKNSAAILNGAANINELGVRAIDTYTIEFTLEYPYYDFLNLLTQSSAMPCNREFFEFTKGKYGMSAEATASNGAFYLKEWNYDPYWDNNYIIMRRNKSYSEKNYVYPYSLNFFITGDKSIDETSFSENDIDCYVAEKFNDKTFDNSNYTTYQTKTVGLLFNTQAEHLNNYEIREALAKSINREAYAHELSENLSTAYGIIPGGITLQGKYYRDLSPDKLLSVYDFNSTALWQTALNKTGKVSVDNLKITVSDSFSESELIYNISDQWRENLLLSCGVEVVSEKEYETKMSENSYSIALVELNSEKNSVISFFDLFSSGSYSDNYRNTRLIPDISKAQKSTSLSEAIENYSSIEKLILNQYVFIPLFYKNEYFVSNNASDDITYYPFVSIADYKDAKYFD